jgi:hypothetical protein
MPTYNVPQVKVYQDLQASPDSSPQSLRAVVIGGHAFPVRYGVASERELGLLGHFDALADTPFAWPNRPPGGVVDPATVKLWVKDALLEYAEAPIDSTPAVTKTAGKANRVRSAGTNWASATGYARDASLGDRDVKAGDVVRVRYVDEDDEAGTLWTYVRGLLGDPVASQVQAAAASPDNASTQSFSDSISQTGGDLNTVFATVDGSDYEGRPSGRLSETYTIIVLDGSVGGDHTTARLRALSASGGDDVVEFSPSAAGVPTAVGTRGLYVTWDLDGLSNHSDSAEAEGVSPIDLVAGQQWTAEVAQAFTAPVATSSGTYTGAESTTYIVEVVKGGAFATDPTVKVTTLTGSDLGGPVIVPAAASAVVVGTRGVSVAFSGAGLRKGDRYFIPVVAASTGAVRTVVLGHNLPANVADGARVGLTFYVKREALEVPRHREGAAPEVNWTVSSTEITVQDGMTVYDPDLTDGGVPYPVPVVSNAEAGFGVAYAEYVAWLPDLAGQARLASPSADLDVLIPGPTDPVNPLKYGVMVARLNSGVPSATGDTSITFIAVADPNDADSWQDALDQLVDIPGAYGLAPMTRDPAVLQLCQAHVESLSVPDEARWRSLWVSLPGVPEVPVVSAGSDVPGYTAATTSDGDPCLCVIEDDGQTSGTQYTLFRCPAGNGRFLTNGVRGGDVVRALYTSDGFGGQTYTEFVVDLVDSEDQLRVVRGPDAPLSLATRVEVWRVLDPAEEAAAVARLAGSYASDRVCAVWPDTYEYGGLTLPGYYLCAALAGLTGAVPPQQGVTRYEVKGVTAVPRTARFIRGDLDTMAAGGVWIVASDPITGRVFNRHAVTTSAVTDSNHQEEMRRRNRDSVSYQFQAAFEPYIGIVNAIPAVEERFRMVVQLLVDSLKQSTNPLIGGQLVDATIRRLEPYELDARQYVLVLDCIFPEPLNNFLIHLVI